MLDHFPSSPPPQAFHFAGFTWPTYTPIPDQLIDELLPVLTGAELKVTLYICRRTLGFHKVSDNISLTQLLHGIVKKNGERLDWGTGLSKPALLHALHGLHAKGIVKTMRRSSPEHGDEATNYRLCFAEGIQPLIRHGQTSASPPAPPAPVGWRQPDYTPRGQESLPGGRIKNFTTPLVKKVAPQEPEEQETERQETVVVHSIDQVFITNRSDTAGGGGAEIASVSGSAETEKEPSKRTPQTDSNPAPTLVTVSPPPTSGEPPSPTLERQQTGASALIAIGMTAKVAQRLAEHYSLTRIEQKVSYLDFLQQHQPDKVKNPCGWLRKAIEDDFAAPDGYCSAAQREDQLAATLALADQLLAVDPPEPDDVPSEEPTAPDQPIVTDADRALWQEVQFQVQCMGRPAIAALLADARIVTCTADTALIAVPTTDQVRQLCHPRLQLVISRALTQAAGRALTPEYILLYP